MIIKKLTHHYLTALLFLGGLLLSPTAAAKPITNQLKNHASPYLALHATDPVQWQDWNESVVKRALKENKLIYISSGYFSCHWCHVMQRESYKNKKIAKLLNQFFIPVKVDRELNPALDARLIDFVERTQGHAGWPLNVFITPEGYPLIGMTYLPASNFTQVVTNLEKQWSEDSNHLKDIAKQATTQLIAQQQNSSQNKLTTNTTKFLNQQFLSQTEELIDEMQGGFGQQNKFPSVPQLLALLHITQTEKIKPYKKIKWQEFLITTLDSMARQGLYDQINGGFFRYTVDPNWQIPHFEKMLYDNAQLAILYFESAKVFNRADYRAIAIETLQFMQTDMASNIGVIAASISSVDKKGIEGGCYIWQQGDLKKYLTTEQYKIVKDHWKLVSNDALESGYHLIQVKPATDIAKQYNINIKRVKALINSAKIKLKKIRNIQNCPIDKKPVAAWLGLALQAFSTGAKQTGNNSFTKTATQLYQFISTQLWQNNTLYRSIKRKNNTAISIGTAGLEDYALVAKGVLDYALLTNNATAKNFAIKLATQAWQRFYKKDGWYLSEKPLIKYTIGKAVLEDSPLPSPSAILIWVSLQLNNKRLYTQARVALQKGVGDIEESPYWYATQIDVINEFNK